VSVTPHAAATGDNTNTTNLNLINKGAAGAGTTEVGNRDLPTGTNLVAMDEMTVPLNATFVNGVSLAEGDVLALQYEKVGTGLAVGPLQVNVDWEPL
jgi:cobalamin biosynthesis Mg chelatase CobN